MEKPMSLEPKLHVGKNVVLPLPEKNTEFYKWLLENNPFTTDKGCRVKFTGGFSDVKDDVLELSPTSTSLALSKLFQYGKPVPDLDEKIKAGGTFTEIESKWIKGSDIKSHDDAIKKDSCYLEVKLTNRLVKGIDNNGSVLHVYLSSDEGDSLKYINPGEFWPGLAGKRKASLENQKSNNDSNRLNGQRISAIDEILSKNSKIEEKEREKKDKNADVDNINDQIKKMEAELLKLRCAVGECSNPVKRGPVLRNYVVDGGGNFSSDIKKEYETKKKNCEEENISLVARNQELAAYDAWIGKVEALDGDLCIVAFMAEKNKELATINIKIKRQN